MRLANTSKSTVPAGILELKDSRLWSVIRVKMTLTLTPEGLGTVMYPLKGKISFLTKVEGMPCVRTMFLKEVLMDGLG